MTMTFPSSDFAIWLTAFTVVDIYFAMAREKKRSSGYMVLNVMVNAFLAWWLS